MSKSKKELSELLNSKEYQELKKNLLEKVANNSKPTERDLDLLKGLIENANMLYTTTEFDTGITDTEYDQLIEYYINNTNDNSIRGVSNDNKVSHKYKRLRGTLGKIYKITDEDIISKSQKSLDDWIDYIKKELNISNKELENLDVLIQPKFDGVSAIFEFDELGNCTKVLTRGDVTNNEASDITHILKDKLILSEELKDKAPLGIKTEIVMEKELFDVLNKEEITAGNKGYRSERSAVSSIINSKNKDYRTDFLTVIPLRWSNNDEDVHIVSELYTYPHLSTKLGNRDEIRYWSKHSAKPIGITIDGTVITILNKDIQKKLGRKDNKEMYEIAYKFTEVTETSKVTNIIYQIGKLGKVTPVIEFKPVKLKGNKVSRASIYSIKELIDSNINIGDEVLVKYDIVPKVELSKKKSKKELKIIDKCPYCNEILDISDTGELTCKNDKCPSTMIGRLILYCERVGMKQISTSTIQVLFEKGLVRSIPDLYKLTKKDIINLEGFGDKKSDMILEEITKSEKMDSSTFIASLGIRGFSAKKVSDMMSQISIAEVLHMVKEGNSEFFTIFPNFGKKSAISFCKGIIERIDDIVSLLDILDIKETVSDNKPYAYNICFSKIRENDIKGLPELIDETDGKITESVTKKTDVLCVPTLTDSSSKINKAGKYGIPIVTMDKIIDFIRRKYDA